MVTLSDVQKLYAERRYEAVLAAVDEISAEQANELPPDDLDELRLMTAWSHYHLKHFEEAKRAVQGARSSERLDEFLATMAAYVDKDDASLGAFAHAHPDNPAIINALMIRARDPDSLFGDSLILVLSWSFVGQTHTVSAVHVVHNAARALMARIGDDMPYPGVACGMLRYVIATYPEVHGPNWNHRAAAGFWLMKALWAMGPENKHDAVSAGTAALHCWDEALKLDPNNEGFQKSRTGLLFELNVINSVRAK